MFRLWRAVPPQAKFWIYVTILVAIAASYAYVFWRGAEWKRMQIENETAKQTYEIREMQDEIRDNRPSVQRTADRMRSGTF